MFIFHPRLIHSYIHSFTALAAISSVGIRIPDAGIKLLGFQNQPRHLPTVWPNYVANLCPLPRLLGMTTWEIAHQILQRATGIHIIRARSSLSIMSYYMQGRVPGVGIQQGGRLSKKSEQFHSSCHRNTCRVGWEGEIPLSVVKGGLPVKVTCELRPEGWGRHELYQEFREEHCRQRKQQVQTSWGRNMMCKTEPVWWEDGEQRWEVRAGSCSPWYHNA